MKTKNLFVLAAVIIVALFSVALFSSQGDDAYLQEIEAFWADRVDFLKNSSGSPYQQNAQPYQDISYFQADKKYRVSARLDRFTKRETYTIGNSDGTSTKYLKFAYAHFKLDGQKHRLLILKALGFGHNYFTGFGDQTGGLSTYGGGRYLDITIGKSDDIIIDFNKAYNPYCAYVDDYSCPLPPKENLLDVKIEAGERHTP